MIKKQVFIQIYVTVTIIVALSFLLTDSAFGQSKSNSKPATNPGITKAEKKIQRLSAELEEAKEDSKKLNILLELGKLYQDIDPPKTLDYATRALELSQKNNDLKGISDSFNRIGSYYLKKGNYPNALDYYSKSLKINEELGDKNRTADSYHKISRVYRNQNHYALEMECHFKRLKIREELGDQKGISDAYTSIGVVYYYQDNYLPALEYHFKSLKIRKALGNQLNLARTYNNIGVVYFQQYKYSKAMEYYSKSLKIYEELNDKSRLAGALYNIGSSYSKLKQFNKALAFSFKAKTLWAEIGNKFGLAHAYQGIGEIYMKQGKKGSIDYLTRALMLFQSFNKPDLIGGSAGLLSSAYAKMKNFEQAYKYQVLFKKKSDELKNDERTKKITQLELQYEFDKKQKQAQYEHEKEQQKAKFELDKAQLVSEKRKNLNSLLIMSSALLGLLLFVTFNRFRLKKKSNFIIQAEKEKAVNANKAKSEFLANMSHELRTPLNAVIGFSELLSSMVTDPKHKSYTQSIRTAGKSLLTLINDILDLSKIESGMMEINYAPINPRSIFHEIQQIFREKMESKGLSYITDIDESLPHALLLDETRLRQVLLNLVGNAINFTETGYIKLTARQGIRSDQTGQINLIIEVEDTGKGVPPEQQESIFQPFKQQSGQNVRKYGGTGLGLSISKRLTEMMKGRISLESQPGKGSIFTITLENVAISSAEEAIAQEGSISLENITFESARILVVDDVESNRTVLQEMMPRVNLEVVTAENGEVALTMAGKYLPDLIIMDIAMPVMDGFEATRSFKSNPKTKDIPVLVLSASSTVEQKENVMGSGLFAAFLDKPVNVSQLLKELSNYLPHSLKEESDPAHDKNQKPLNFKGLELTQETLERLPRLIEILREEILPEIEDFKQALEMEKVKTFADKIKQLGEEYGIIQVSHFANQLHEYEQSFDIDGIEKKLEDFETMVNDLVSHCEVYDEQE